MRVIQILTTVAYGDAIGNETLALKEVIKKQGYSTGIYAENIDPRIKDKEVKYLRDLPKLDEKDVIIYHLAIKTDLNYKLKDYPGKKIIIYHNITPPKFFAGYSDDSKKNCEEGLREAEFLGKYADYCLADSSYNKQDLINMGYKCDIDVLPLLISFDDYEKAPSKKILSRFDDDYVNILFTGRIAPNKKQEDIIEAFYYYNKYINPKSRLFLVGSYGGMEKYYYKLQQYVKELGVKNVHFTGHIKFNEILAYFRIADLFLCMSEHEGFCVPLAEAMYFNIPIVAYDSSAIPDTLGGSGFLLKEKNPKETAGVIHRILTDDKLKNDILHNQQIRFKDFQHEKVEEQFVKYLKNYLSK